MSWDEAHLPYGCGAAPYLGSAKRGAGLPFPVASFLCALDPVKKKKEKNHLNYTIHRFVPNDRKRASKQAKLFFWNRSIDRHRRRDLLLLVSRSFFFLPSPPPSPPLPRFPFIYRNSIWNGADRAPVILFRCVSGLAEAQFVSPGGIARNSIYELNRFSSRLGARNRRTNPE